VVIVAQLPAHGRRHRLTADAQVDEAVNLERSLQRRDPLLEAADPPHRFE
jgi:hypothetical protein